MGASGAKYHDLKRQESLEVIILGRGGIGVYGRVWNYQLWTPGGFTLPGEKPYSELCSETDFPLFAGERAVVGGHEIVLPPSGGVRLIVDKIEVKNFSLEKGQIVRLLRPEKARKGHATYSSSLKADVNGREAEFFLAALMYGRVVSDRHAEPLATITGINPPEGGRGYLLHAEPAINHKL